MPEVEGSDLGQQVQAFLDFQSQYKRSSPLTVGAYRNDLGQFLRFCRLQNGPKQAQGVQREHVLRFAVSLQGLAASTIRRRLASLSSLFHFLQDMGVVSVNPVRGVALPKEPSHEVHIVTPAEYQAMLALAEEPWQRAALVLLATTAMRRGEVIGARLEDLDLEHRQLLVRGKGGKNRRVPLSDDAVREVCGYLPDRRPLSEDGRLLVNRLGRPLNGQILRRLLQRLAEGAGIQGRLTPHAFRHSAATAMLLGGADIKTVADLLGHASIQSTARYAHSSPASQRAAVEALAAGLRS